MKPEDFDFLSALLKERSGLMLKSDKIYLLESRLTPIARKQGFENLDGLVQKLRVSRTGALSESVTEAMTTNESFFFRDNTPFELFKTYVLPVMKTNRAGTKRLRIWCAAASTGQEPYSLAIVLKELASQWAGWNIEIIGTDISPEVLNKAKDGLYSQFEVQRGLPIQLLMKYFTQEGDLWRISSEIRSMVKYKPFNLLESFQPLGTFDVIFCRNVLIYFDHPTKAGVLERMRRQVADDGTLFLGAAETVLGITDKFKPVRGQRGMYQPS